MLLSFEQESILNYIETQGKAELSDEHKKDGGYSLKWTHRKGDTLRLDVPIGYKTPPSDGKDSRVPGWGVYIYSDGAEQTLTVEFLKGERVCAGFEIYVNFKGWRSLALRFDYDMNGKAEEDMDAMRIMAGNDGCLWFDRLITCNLFPFRSPVASFQLPFVKDYYGNNSFLALYNSVPSVCSRASYDMYYIREKYTRYLLSIDKYDISYEELRRRLEEWKDRPIVYKRALELCDGMDNTAEYNFVTLRDAAETLFALARLYKTEKRGGGEYISLIRKMIDEGFAAGSSMGVMHHIDYSLRMLYPSVFLMETELRREGLFDAVSKAICWFSGFGTVFAPAEITTADTYNTRSQAFLIYALLSGTDEYIQAVSDWINRTTEYTNGLLGLLKPDGSMYHHCNHYTAYASDGLTGLMPVIYSLSGTSYEISSAAAERINKVIGNMIFYTEKRVYPIAMSGRHPDGTWAIDKALFDVWEKCTYDTDKYKKRMGQLTMNRACAAFHRENGFMASVKGFSRYLWGNESYIADNLYGRYISYGYLEVFKGDMKSSGFSHDGWDWAMFPGTTAEWLPVSEMRSKIYNLDKDSAFEEMLISDRGFAGGVDDGQNGLFSMELAGHPKYDKTFFAKKSYFFVDGAVICMGSDISSSSGNPVYTTVMQRSGNAVKMKDKMFVDETGTGYYIVRGHFSVSTGPQLSQDEKGRGETQGVFGKVWIDHGINPKNSDYEYVIVPNGQEAPRYSVLCCDNVCHAIRCGGKLYAAVFDPSRFGGAGELLSVSHPVLIIMDKTQISVCEPDLGLYGYDGGQYGKNGERKEVSIYSRDWIANDVKKYNITIETTSGIHSLAAAGGDIYKLTR